MKPLVTIICLSYNHAPYIQEALTSVKKQSYSQLEIIVVDDGSSDESPYIIRDFAFVNPEFKIMLLDRNLGNCAAFNKGYSRARGKYIIDFATDDIMTPDRVERQVQYFESLSANYGVIYSNAKYIDESGKFLYNHFGGAKSLKRYSSQYSGEVYQNVLQEFFIPPPTMMIRKSVLDELGGYDEELAYEDFDFWVRSSRRYLYGYQDELLTYVRKTKTSYSNSWYKPGDKQLFSTYKVCLKASQYNNSLNEKIALTKRIKLEIRQAVFSNNHAEADCFFNLLISDGNMSGLYKALYWLNKKRLNLSLFRTIFHKIKYYRFSIFCT